MLIITDKGYASPEPQLIYTKKFQLYGVEASINIYLINISNWFNEIRDNVLIIYLNGNSLTPIGDRLEILYKELNDIKLIEEIPNIKIKPNELTPYLQNISSILRQIYDTEHVYVHISCYGNLIIIYSYNETFLTKLYRELDTVGYKIIQEYIAALKKAFKDFYGDQIKPDDVKILNIMMRRVKILFIKTPLPSYYDPFTPEEFTERDRDLMARGVNPPYLQAISYSPLGYYEFYVWLSCSHGNNTYSYSVDEVIKGARRYADMLLGSDLPIIVYVMPECILYLGPDIMRTPSDMHTNYLNNKDSMKIYSNNTYGIIILSMLMALIIVMIVYLQLRKSY